MFSYGGSYNLFLQTSIKPDETIAKPLLRLPNGIVSGKPTTDKSEPKLSLEKAAETIGGPGNKLL